MFKRAKRVRLYEVVADEVEKAILEKLYAVGSQLPSEQSLADQFEVSRNVVREALKVLKERGLVEVLDGSGAYVTNPTSGPASSALGRYIRSIGAESAIDALYETRIHLESLNASLAAQRASAEQIEELAHYLELMGQNIQDAENWSKADLDFHISLAHATNNPFQVLLLEPIIDQLHGVIEEGFLMSGATEQGYAAHVKILEGIRSRNAEMAYNEMAEHLKYSEDIIKKSLADHNAKKEVSE